MNTLSFLRIISRVTFHISIYGAIGALLLGNLAARIIELLTIFISGKTLDVSWIGFLLGALFMSVVGLTTGRRRSKWESFQMVFGGCVMGAIVACLFGGWTALAAWYFWGDVAAELILWLEILCGAIVGTLYFTFHPKYAPREEPVIIFSDDYLKDEKIEWK